MFWVCWCVWLWPHFVVPFARNLAQRFLASQPSSLPANFTSCSMPPGHSQTLLHLCWVNNPLHLTFNPLITITCTFPALFCFRHWLLQQHGPFIWTAGLAIMLFRSELAILLGIILLMELWSGRVVFWRLLGHGIPAGFLWLGNDIVACICALCCSAIIF